MKTLIFKLFALGLGLGLGLATFLKKDQINKLSLLQLIYDFCSGGGSIGLVSLLPDKIDSEKKRQFNKIGIEIPTLR